jgi:phosphoglycolate phosphatase
MTFRLAIFDLDGTLADSFPWFLTHLGSTAERYRFRAPAQQEHEALRHLGPRELLQSLEVPLWKLPLIARHMRRLKSADLAQIPLFDGVPEMLQTLAAGGLRLAMVSSDHEANVRRQLGPALANLVSHYACGAGMFGKPAKFRRVLARAGVPAAEAIAIGDEIRDIEAARAVGLRCAAVTWGYAAPAALRARAPDLVFDAMAEIAPALLAMSGR